MILGMEHSWSLYRRLFGFLRPYLRMFFAALLAMAIYGATDGAVPYILKRVLDDIFGKQNAALLWPLVAVIVGFAIIRGTFGFLERYFIAAVGHSIVRDIRDAIARHLLRLDAGFYGRETTGSLLSRMTNDTLLVRTALTDAVGQVLRDTVRIVALLSMAIYLDPVLGSIAFLGFPIALIPVMKFGKKVRRLSRQGQDHFGGLTGVLQEMILGAKVVQSFCRESTEAERFRRENAKFTETLKKAERYGALSGPTNEMLASLAIAAIILYGGYSVIGGVRTQGDFIAFITSIFLLYEPLKKMGRVNTTIQLGLSAAERIFEILDTEPNVVDPPNPRTFDSATPRIVFEDVWFQYPRVAPVGVNGANGPSEHAGAEAEHALSAINLTIEPGQTVALVGMSGGGKSTLVNLLPRFYDPTRGRVLLNGFDLREYSLHSLRAASAIVSQHTFLFNDTVLANIGYGRAGATREEIIAAAQVAYAHDFILRLPEGYDTVIGEQGLRLSGGERARIAMARALLKNSPILILDEATASLDSEAERLVQDAMNNLMKNRTVLVIAHRLATIRRADSIAVIVRGRIVEQGTHDELLARGADYARLYRLQFQDEPTAADQVHSAVGGGFR